VFLWSEAPELGLQFPVISRSAFYEWASRRRSDRGLHDAS
jgi:hypothetical protein